MKPVTTAQEAIEAAADLIGNFTQSQHVAQDIKNGIFPEQSPKREAMASAIRAISVAEDPLIAGLDKRNEDLGKAVAYATQRFTKAEAERDILKAKADKLAEALRYMVNHAGQLERNQGIYWEATEISRAALAEYKGETE